MLQTYLLQVVDTDRKGCNDVHILTFHWRNLHLQLSIFLGHIIKIDYDVQGEKERNKKITSFCTTSAFLEMEEKYCIYSHPHTERGTEL